VVTKAVTITSSVLFANVATILGNPLGSGAQCTGCHNGTNAVPDWRSSTAGLAGRLAGVIDGTQQSLLLLCPTFGSGAGGSSSCTGMPAPQPGFGSGGFANYDAFLTWIFNGQP
jgi:hypothetical protein